MKEKIKGLFKSKAAKVAVIGAAVSSAVTISAAAADETVTAMTGALTTLQGTLVSGVAAIAPIALVVTGAVLLWKFGVRFFKSLAK